MTTAARYSTLVLLTWCAAVHAQAPTEVWAPPALTGRVVDGSGVLSPSFERELSARLQALDDASSIQVVVVTVDTLGGLPARAYARRLTREWGVGQRGLNNGALVLVAPREGEVWISVGTGLEWQVSDAEASEAAAAMTTHFRAGDFESGLRDGVERLASLAVSVPWDVRYHSLSDLPATRSRAVGAVIEVQGSLSDGGTTLEADGERVQLLYPPYWEGGNLGDGRRLIVTGRVASAAPLVVQVLGVSD